MSVEVTMNNNLTKLLEKQTKEFQVKIRKEIAKISVKHFKDGFRTGGGQTDAGKWAKRKNQESLAEKKQLSSQEKRELGRAILVKTGSLRNSIKIYKITSDQIIIRSNMPYSARINFGTNNMPAREFLGKSSVLAKKIEVAIEKMLKSNIK